MNFIPQFIAEKIEEQQNSGQFTGFVVTFDISGSVELCEQLMQFGKEGIEELSLIINSIFHPAINAIYNSGGFVASFAGDAIMGIFPGYTTQLPRILGCVKQSMATINNNSRYRSKCGNFKIQAKAGIGFGEIEFNLPLYGQNSRIFYFSGAAVINSVFNQSNAQKNEIIFDQSLKGMINRFDDISYSIKENLFVLNLNDFSVPIKAKPVYNYAVPRAVQRKFIADLLMKGTRRSEFKSVASLFVSLADSSIESLRKLLDLADEFGAYVNSIESIAENLVCLVQFGAPVATELYLTKAIHCALAARKMLSSKIKISITEGKVFSGYIGNDIRSTYTNIGSTVNLAARIVSKAEWGKILVSDNVYLQMAGSFSFAERMIFSLKGLSEPQTVYELEKEQSLFADTLDNEFFGREGCLRKLSDFTNSLFKQKKSGIYTILGTPGIGKTAFIQQYCRQNKFQHIFKYECSPLFTKDYSFLKALALHLLSAENFGKTALDKDSFDHLFLKFKESAKEQKIPREKLKKLYRLKPLIGSLSGVAEYLKFIDLLPQAEKAVSIIMAVRDLLETVLYSERLTVVIDNAQWLDENSRKIYKLITKSSPNNSLLIILLSRNEDSLPVLQLPAESRFTIESDALSGLSDADSQSMISALLKIKISKAQRSKIFQASAGNPFYITEFCKMLNSGSLKDGFSDIPPGIDNLLSARLDSLSDSLALVIKKAAVIGYQFNPEIVYAIFNQSELKLISDRDSFDHVLIQGENEKIWTRNLNGLYSFDQLLFQEAAYQRQLTSDLKTAHESAALFYEKSVLQTGIELARTAYHFYKAEKSDKAINYYISAAEAASAEYAPHFALENYNMAEIAGAAIADFSAVKLAEILFSSGNVLQQALADYQNAENKYQSALALLENCLNESKILRSDILNHLGMLNQYRAKFDLAFDYYNSAYKLRLQYLGREDAETVKILNNIGIVYWHKGDSDNALKYYTEVLSLLHDDSKENNSLLIASASLNIANLYYKTKPDQAKKYYQRTLEIYKKLLPPDHHNLAAVANNLGELHKSLGEFSIALDYHQQAYAIRKKIFGNDHPLTAASINNLSEVNRLLGNYGKALILQKQSAAIKEKSLGFEHPSVAASYNNLGQIYKGLNKNEIALRYFNRAYQIWLKTLGENHQNLSMVIYNLADLCRLKGDYTQALDYYNKCIGILKFNYPKGHPNEINVFINASVVHECLLDFDGAISLLDKAKLIADKFLLKDSSHYAVLMNNYSCIFKKQNKIALAIEYAELSKNILEHHVGINHPETALVYLNLGDIYYISDKYSQSIKYYNKAYRIFKHDLHESMSMIDTCMGIGELLSKNGKKVKAEIFFRGALVLLNKLSKNNKTKILKEYFSLLKDYGIY